MKTGDPFRVVLRSLRFDDGGAAELRQIKLDQWPALLALTDEARLTLPLGIRCKELLPEPVRSRILANLAANALRHQRAIETHRELMNVFERDDIPFVFLKGLTHFPYFCRDPRYRQQYDIDVYSPPENLGRLFRAATALGYQRVDRGHEARADHLPVMVRKTGWRWRGDYYDPDMPLHLEIHYRLWDPEVERFAVNRTRQVGEQPTTRLVSGIELPALNLPDTFSYAARHIVRHLFRGSLCPGHVYEFAHFLENSASDDTFWSNWKRATADEHLAEALASNLATHCFGCSLNGGMKELIAQLPAAVRKWFDLFALSPLLSLDRPNKDELFLHLLLVSGRNKFEIAKRRLFPSLPSRFVRNPYAGESGRFADQLSLLARRSTYHLRSLGTLARSGARWLQAIQ
jgi:hypothetical protein